LQGLAGRCACFQPVDKVANRATRSLWDRQALDMEQPALFERRLVRVQVR